MTRRTRILAVLVSLLAAACGGGGNAGSPPAPAPETTAPGDVEAMLRGSRAVRMTGDDGIVLEGRLFGDGDVGVVLAHGMSIGTGQAGWFPFAPVLAAEGFRVLTFNFRGFCPGGLAGCSEGTRRVHEMWRDVATALDVLREEGAERVFVVGASMGGIASLAAASMPGVAADGVVSLSSPQWPSRVYGEDPSADITPGVLRRIDEPKLFVAGRDDVDAAFHVAFADEARALHRDAEEPKQLEILPSDLHSSELLTGEVAYIQSHERLGLGEPSTVADEATRLLLEFFSAPA